MLCSEDDLVILGEISGTNASITNSIFFQGISRAHEASANGAPKAKSYPFLQTKEYLQQSNVVQWAMLGEQSVLSVYLFRCANLQFFRCVTL